MRTLFNKIFRSLQRTIFAIILGLILIPTTILGGISYIQYREIITENAKVLNQKNTSQIASNIEGILKNIQNSSLSFYQNEMVRNYLLASEPEQLNDAWSSLNQYVMNQLAYEEYIYAVDFVRTDGHQHSSSSITKGISEKLKQKLLEKNGKAIFITDVEVENYGGIKKEELYGYARCINDINDIGIPIGYQQIYIKKDKILHLISDDMVAGEGYYIIENGKIIISTDAQKEGETVASVFPNLYLDEEGSQEITYEGKVMMFSCSEIQYPGWHIVKKTPLTQVQGETAVGRQLLIASGVLAVLLCGFMGFFLSRFVIKPLKQLETSMKQIEDNHFKLKLQEGGYEEISLLAKAFNRMTTHLDELVNRVYRAEIKEKDAQIQAMQAYINPHFLYNTLDTICWMSRMEQAQETCNLIEALSKLFRLSIKDTSKTTTVAGEIEHIKNYIMIQECRHTDSIEFVTVVEEGMMEYETVRFVLQPLVENAIFHGLEPGEEHGTIRIEVKAENECLMMSVSDDGVGADINELEQLLIDYEEGLRGMGIANVNDRIKLCFGERYGVQFQKGERKGLVVSVVQPLRKKGGL